MCLDRKNDENMKCSVLLTVRHFVCFNFLLGNVCSFVCTALLISPCFTWLRILYRFTTDMRISMNCECGM